MRVQPRHIGMSTLPANRRTPLRNSRTKNYPKEDDWHWHSYKKTFTKPLPAGAKIIVRTGRRLDKAELLAAYLGLRLVPGGWHALSPSKGRVFPGSHALRSSGTCDPKCSRYLYPKPNGKWGMYTGFHREENMMHRIGDGLATHDDTYGCFPDGAARTQAAWQVSG